MQAERISISFGAGQLFKNLMAPISGTPFFYPLVAGALDTLGGLAAARAFSLACMLFATVMVYWTTRQLFQHDTALLAAALFAVQGAVIFLGWFATYDALCRSE